MQVGGAIVTTLKFSNTQAHGVYIFALLTVCKCIMSIAFSVPLAGNLYPELHARKHSLTRMHTLSPSIACHLSELYAGFEDGSVVVYNLRGVNESVGAKGQTINNNDGGHIIATLKDHTVCMRAWVCGCG